MSNTYFGIYKAVVVDNDDPQFSYRVVCQIPQVLGDAHSNWCEPILPTLYVPRIGDVVWVQFVDGDSSTPLYQSRVHVTKEMSDPNMLQIDDFTITPRKMNNSVHYLY